MADDISILISGKLNEEVSKDKIKQQLKTIENDLKVKLKLDIDTKILNSLNNFSKSMEKVKHIIEEQGKAFKEEIKITEKANGVIEKRILLHRNDGAVFERVIEDKRKQTERQTEAVKKEKGAVDDLIDSEIKHGKLLKENIRLNAKREETSKATTYRVAEGTNVTVREAGGKETGLIKNINHEQVEKAKQQLDSFQSKYNNLLKTLQQSKNAKFVDEHAVKYLQNYVKNMEALDEKTKRYIETQYNVIKNNAQMQNDYRTNWANEQGRLAKSNAQEENRIAKLGSQIGIYKELKGEQATQEQLAKTLSSVYKNQQVTITDLNNVTGKYTALIRENGKENVVLKGTLDSNTGALYKISEGTKEATNATKGMMEQLKIAMVRVPVWIKNCPYTQQCVLENLSNCWKPLKSH